MTNDPRFTFIGPGLIELPTPQEQIATLTARIGVLEASLRDLWEWQRGVQELPSDALADRVCAALAASPEAKPTGEPCPHLRVGTRDGKPWTCRDCGAVRVNSEWSAAPADARLIAAAPELLDALRFIHEHAFEAKWSGDERGLGLVEAAIAKAEGRAP